MRVVLFYLSFPSFYRYFILVEQGYITSYVEDIPQVGAFNYRLLGFKDPPADYYPRAFLLAAQNRRDLDYRHCYGSEKAHGYQFDLATKIFEQYPDKSKFLFHFTGKEL